MKNKIHSDMIAATRLTQEGRLTEATSLIQRIMKSGHAAVADIVDLKAEPVDGEIVQMSTVKSGTPARRGVRDWLRGFKIKPVSTTIATPAKSTLPQKPVPSPLHTAPAPGSFTRQTFSGAAGTRDYKLFVPKAYKGKPLPLIVMLHGCSQSADDFAAGTQMNPVGEERGCFVVYPEQSSAANGSKCWNWFKPGDQKRDAGEPSLIAGIVRQISADFAIDQKRIYASGLSAGGAAAAVLGATYPDLFAAIGVHSGLACGAASDMASAFAAMSQGKPLNASVIPKSATFHGRARRVPTIVFHGDTDTTVHPRNGDNVIAQVLSADVTELRKVSKNGRASGGHAYHRTCYFDAAGREVLELWVVHGGGHAWSGGSRSGSYTDPRGPDASREMARFFFNHKHP